MGREDGDPGRRQLWKQSFHTSCVILHLSDSPETASGSGLLPDRSSTEVLLPSAPTPQPRGPMALERRLSWISSEILSRFFRAVLYSPFARVSLVCRSSTVFFSCWSGRWEAQQVTSCSCWPRDAFWMIDSFSALENFPRCDSGRTWLLLEHLPIYQTESHHTHTPCLPSKWQKSNGQVP
jgi:hypothetical protein